MSAQHADEIVGGYFARLEAALAPVPEPRRKELIDDVREHIAEVRASLSNETDADLLNIFDRLGDPADMAAAELGRGESNPPTQHKSRILDIAAIVLLLLFWPIGVVLLWMSDAWTTRDKLIGTLVPPGGYLGIFILGPLAALGTFGAMCRTASDESGHILSSTCASADAQTGINIGAALLLVLYLIGPILSAAYLAARLRRRMSAERSEAGTGVAVTIRATARI